MKTSLDVADADSIFTKEEPTHSKKKENGSDNGEIRQILGCFFTEGRSSWSFIGRTPSSAARGWLQRRVIRRRVVHRVVRWRSATSNWSTTHRRIGFGRHSVRERRACCFSLRKVLFILFKKMMLNLCMRTVPRRTVLVFISGLVCI